MIPTIILLALSVALVIITIFLKQIIHYFKLSPSLLTIIIVVLIIVVYFIKPLFEHRGQVRLESKVDKIDKKLDELKGSLTWKPFTEESVEKEERIPPDGIRKKAVDLKDEFSMVFWFTPQNFEQPNLKGKYSFFDLYSQYQDKNRITMFAQKVQGENNLIVKIFDANKNSFLIRQNISDWKDGQKYFIALTFSIPKNNVVLYINGAVVQNVNIDNLFLNKLGPNLFLGGYAETIY